MTDSPLDPQTILESARQIRPELPDLLPPAQAEEVDQQLAAVLTQSKSGNPVESEILNVLRRDPETYDWLVEFLDVERVSKGPSLPGRPGPVSAPRYVCPEGDYVWFRRTSDQPVPRCPSHGELVLEDGQA